MPNEQDATSEPSQSEGFIHYQSFLSQYPSLRVRLPLSGIQRTPIKQSEPLLDKLDLKPLKLVATYKWLEANTSRCLCQYEIPGGGECRDNDCQAIHLSKLSAIEPSGTHFYYSFMVAYHLISFPSFPLIVPHLPRTRPLSLSF